ncbi:MAG TPA: hypothetical protein P5250_04685 [Bacteroidales bacterium]|nr:hypothetical protein [Bacteroidales bacterium]
MRILIVAATDFEIPAIFKQKDLQKNNTINKSNFLGHKVYSMVTGIGMVPTAYFIGNIFNHYKFDVAINVGIAGLICGQGEKGDVFFVSKDCFFEIYDRFNNRLDFMEDDKNFLFKNFIHCNYNFSSLLAFYDNNIPFANGITVNKTQIVSKAELPREILSLPIIETMESAAFFYACVLNNIPFIALRSISNYTYELNRATWQLNLAINNLHKSLIYLLNVI